MKQTAVEWLVEKLSYRQSDGTIISHHSIITKLVEQALEMEKEREKSIFSIAYRMTPIEFGKQYCELEFEKFNKTFKQQEQ